GLGSLEKRKEVRKLMGDQNPLLLCLQETKLQTWASGGLLTIWDSSVVEVWSSESREHVLWCHGCFTKSGEEFFVANVYAPCDIGAKQGLWEEGVCLWGLQCGREEGVCLWGLQCGQKFR
ncbi:cytochrome P450, partial [Trifolium medium]|nr:cytochrome P450 [Trifolium medium]